MTTVDEVIEKFTPEGDFVPARVVEDAMQWLEENDPEALTEWMWSRRLPILKLHYQRKLQSQRTATQHRARARAFGEAVSSFDEGDVEPLSHFDVVHVVDGDDTRRRVGDMTGEDHFFVAETHREKAKPHLLAEAFHRQVARKVGDKRTADVMDEETYERLYVSIVRGEAA